MATNEDDDGDGLAPEVVNGEIPEAEAKSEDSSLATNEDKDRDELTHQENKEQIPECASLHSETDVELSRSWKAIMFVKLGLNFDPSLGLQIVVRIWAGGSLPVNQHI
ncbi:hypothetical protein B0H11DRAFT_1909136 [Mycena galericulata]|nr:hypothetical protein B0H11DRAFT_1909136 [Mycena galericulata]